MIAVFLSFGSSKANAQSTAGSSASEEPRYLFNMPTAGVLQRGVYAIEGWAYGGGGSFVSLSVGLSEQLTFGIAYGAGNLIGSGSPDWNELPGVMVRYRIFEEELNFPAITIGFESQGRENYLDGANRFERKSPGFFAAATKNYALLGFIALHGGINYSLENDDDKDLNFYFGVEKTIGKELSAYAQYDAAINDNNKTALGDGRGYLDMGLRWSLGKGMTIELNLANISDNFKHLDAASRSVRLEYVHRFD
ncbi:hypothetical protein [Chloroherpeton thalassium]|uniref:hypothetical protein n=1 Tax=Chloroherpeton thalassium TaxID=100716 RepID=UPI00145E51D6|nr:hypothetical protein [Chloroherpeton thalassium]